eukprot:1046920-Amphidinium_carterae.1
MQSLWQLKDLIVSGSSKDLVARSLKYYAWVPSLSNPADWSTRGESSLLAPLSIVRPPARRIAVVGGALSCRRFLHRAVLQCCLRGLQSCTPQHYRYGGSDDGYHDLKDPA